MKSNTYHVYLLLGRQGELANVLQGMLINTNIIELLMVYCRKSASCTHVSAVLHALSGMKQTFDLPPSNLPELDDNDVLLLPCTSKPCVWKEPRSRKESNLCVSDAVFEKHDYSKPVKQKIRQLKDYDPRPSELNILKIMHVVNYLSFYRRSKEATLVYPFCLILNMLNHSLRCCSLVVMICQQMVN